MPRIWININLIVFVIATILTIRSDMKINNIKKMLSEMNGDDLLPEDIKIKLYKYLKLKLIGLVVSLISFFIGLILS